MKQYLILALFCGAMCNQAYTQGQTELNTPKQRTSYSVGFDIGTNLTRQGLEVDAKALAAGVIDALAGRARIAEAEQKELIKALQKKMQQERLAENEAQGKENLAAGQAFLTANAKKPGVVALPSGLQYKVIRDAAGPKPEATDKVKTHYHGTLIDGTVFDSSVDRGEPIVFPVNGVIAGWSEALQLMPVGSKWQLFVPSNLAYGARGAGGKIGPNTTLIFDVELLGIEAP